MFKADFALGALVQSFSGRFVGRFLEDIYIYICVVAKIRIYIFIQYLTEVSTPLTFF